MEDYIKQLLDTKSDDEIAIERDDVEINRQNIEKIRDKVARRQSQDESQDKLRRLLKNREGENLKLHYDTKKNPTIGSGINLRDEGNRVLLNKRGISVDDILEGKRILTVDENESILDENIERKHNRVKEIQKDRFPDTKLNTDQEAALTSLTYNSGKLIGPNLSNYLNVGDIDEASKEIMLRSNKDRLGGVTARRLYEADLFSPGSSITLNEDEKKQLLDEIKSVKNQHTRTELINQFPELISEELSNKKYDSLKKLFPEG